MRPRSLECRIALTVFALAAIVMGLVVCQTLASSLVAATAAAQMATGARRALVRGLLVALAGAALIAVVSLAIGHLLTRRLERLRQASRRWAAGELGVRAGLAGGDEVAQLGADFDRMAAQLEARVAELRLVQSAVEHTQDAVVITTTATDRDGAAILYVNPAFVALTGHDGREVMGRPPRVLRGASQDPAVLAGLREAVAAEQPWSGEVAIRRRNGTDLPVDLRIAPVRDGTGRLASWVATFRDLTARKQAEVARARLEQELRQAQKMEAVGQLTEGLAHDFNNLLTVVLGNLGQAVEETPERAPARRMIERAIAAGERGTQLTKRLLALGRRQPHRPQPMDVARLITDMSEMLRRTLGETIDLRIAGTQGLWATACDRAQLETALLNLAINARDAMPLGGRLLIETANVVLDAAEAAARGGIRPGEYVTIAVTDTGIGMPPHVVAQAFEPFFTTKDVGQGSGLGLSMVYGFVTQSGGHVHLASEVSRGTTVRMTLPRSCQTAAQGSPFVAPRAAAVPGGGQILLVEDDRDVREVAAMLLADLGYGVEHAASGQEALALLERGTPADLLFTDIVLPGGMSGRELAAQACARRPALRVLYTSGYTVEEIQSQDRLATSVPLLVKPYRRDELAAKVREVIGHEAGAR